MSTQFRTITFLAVLAMTVAACGDGEGGTTSEATSTSTSPTTTTLPSTTTTEPTTTTSTSATTTTTTAAAGTVIYLMVDTVSEGAPGPHLVPVFRPGIPDDPASALGALFDGPTPDEAAGLPTISTAIPAETELHSVTMDDGIATVDLTGTYDDGGGSFGMFARLAQVVFTLTRDPEIEGVDFVLDGEPVDVFSAEGIILDHPQTRADYYDLLPPIFVDTPAWGSEVTSPFTVQGVSNVFEAVFQVMLTDGDGLPLFESTVMADCGTGCWGDFSVEVAYDHPGDEVGALIVWEPSPRDGAPTNVREYPIWLR